MIIDCWKQAILCTCMIFLLFTVFLQPEDAGNFKKDLSSGKIIRFLETAGEREGTTENLQEI
jgi:hypothetical protein